MGILNNAIESIVIGLEDYELAKKGDDKRYISCARNLFAGILLLFKHKLSELSPDGSDEVLIKSRIRPEIGDNGHLEWIGKGSKTVDVSQIEERFKSLKINVDWRRIRDINEYRNDIEHYYSENETIDIDALISESFLVIRDFIANELKEDPKEILGQYGWEILTNVNEVFTAEKESCNERLQEYQWVSNIVYQAVIKNHCPYCLSCLISLDENDELVCKSCNEPLGDAEFIEDSLYNEFKGIDVMNIQDGGEAELSLCISCDTNTYSRSEERCYICGNFQDNTCGRCGMQIPSEEIDGNGLCSYCQYQMDKYWNE